MAEVREGEILAGKYRVDRLLGEGGMGVVVAATHIELDHKVALKFMLPAFASAPEAVKRFTREAKAAVKLKSEHVARVLDVGTLESGAPFIAMEYLEGRDLGQLLGERGGPLPVEEIAEYVIQACDALAEAHKAGIVHRDLKPSNLFRTERADGTPLVKVLDFGISKASALGDSNLSMTSSHAILGSPYYMSPEQMKSSRDVDARSDVWSLGVVMYELASRRVPFDGDTMGQLMAKVLTERPAPLASVRPGLPPAFVALVERCLMSEPGQRAPDVAEIAVSLAPLAPPRARPIADRVETMLRGPTSQRRLEQTAVMPSRPQAISSPEISVRTPASLPQVTASSWARESSGGKRAPIVAIVVGAVLVFGLAGAGLLFALRAPSKPAVGLTPAATAEPKPSASSAPEPPPALPSASAAPEASAAPVVSAAPTANAKSAVAAPHANVKPAIAAPTKPAASAAPAASTPKKKDVLNDWN